MKDVSKVVSVEEQDRIIAEMQAGQKKILEKKDLVPMKEVRKKLPALVKAVSLIDLITSGDGEGAAELLLSCDDKASMADVLRLASTHNFEQRGTHSVESLAAHKELFSDKVDNRAFKQSSRPLYVEPRDVKQVGRTTVTVSTGRPDQSDFKRRVSLNYGGKCAISGHEVYQVLQAAHIAPFATDRNNNTSNGILMDVVLHVLFDAGLMSINPEDMTVHFNCTHPMAALYEGTKIATPKVSLDIEALTIHWNRFK